MPEIEVKVPGTIKATIQNRPVTAQMQNVTIQGMVDGQPLRVEVQAAAELQALVERILVGVMSVAPDDASYVVTEANPTLVKHRVLTGTTNKIIVTDNGPGDTVEISTPQAIHADATPTFYQIRLNAVAPVAPITLLHVEGASECVWHLNVEYLGGLNKAAFGQLARGTPQGTQAWTGHNTFQGGFRFPTTQPTFPSGGEAYVDDAVRQLCIWTTDGWKHINLE
jgi:hypothetical protein